MSDFLITSNVIEAEKLDSICICGAHFTWGRGSRRLEEVALYGDFCCATFPDNLILSGNSRAFFHVKSRFHNFGQWYGDYPVYYDRLKKRIISGCRRFTINQAHDHWIGKRFIRPQHPGLVKLIEEWELDNPYNL